MHKQIHWKNLAGNPYHQKINPSMLSENGYIEPRKVKPVPYIQGQNKEWYNVTYDKQYVIEKIVNNVLEPLNPNSYNDFQKLISECWKYWKNETKEVQK